MSSERNSSTSIVLFRNPYSSDLFSKTQGVDAKSITSLGSLPLLTYPEMKSMQNKTMENEQHLHSKTKIIHLKVSLKRNGPI